MAAKKVAVLVGTEKGAYIFRSGAGRSRWTAEGPLFAGEPVHHLAYDPRDGESADELVRRFISLRPAKRCGKSHTPFGSPSVDVGS